MMLRSLRRSVPMARPTQLGCAVRARIGRNPVPSGRGRSLCTPAGKPVSPSAAVPAAAEAAPGFSYLAFAKAYPFTNNVLIATVKTSAADLVAQCVIERKPVTQIDWQRNLVFCLFGAVYLGAFQYWYQVHARRALPRPAHLAAGIEPPSRCPSTHSGWGGWAVHCGGSDYSPATLAGHGAMADALLILPNNPHPPRPPAVRNLLPAEGQRGRLLFGGGGRRGEGGSPILFSAGSRFLSPTSASKCVLSMSSEEHLDANGQPARLTAASSFPARRSTSSSASSAVPSASPTCPGQPK